VFNYEFGLLERFGSVGLSDCGVVDLVTAVGFACDDFLGWVAAGFA
jgi:hypothetical protein